MVYVAEVSEVSTLVAASAKGDEAAWNELVRRYAPLVLAVIRSHQLPAADAADVSQTVWLRLVEHLADLREPEALPGWLVTTTQRECGRNQQRAQKIFPVDPQTDGVMKHGMSEEADVDILRAELRQAVRDGLGELPERDQSLLRLRAADPPTSYQEISKMLKMPIGSIGPSLRRSLDRLRRSSAMQAYMATKAPNAHQAGRRLA
jgi:RNA polymerase sigma factor (sigma-70 family)